LYSVFVGWVALARCRDSLRLDRMERESFVQVNPLVSTSSSNLCESKEAKKNKKLSESNRITFRNIAEDTPTRGRAFILCNLWMKISRKLYRGERES